MMSKEQDKISGLAYEYGDGMYSYREYKKLCKTNTRNHYKKQYKRKYKRLIDKLFKTKEL